MRQLLVIALLSIAISVQAQYGTLDPTGLQPNSYVQVQQPNATSTGVKTSDLMRDGIYVPTVTKNLASDTVVAVYTHFWSRNDSIGVISGKVLMNSIDGTVETDLQISLPPGFTTDFTDVDNDASGHVTASTRVTPFTPYAAYCYARASPDVLIVKYKTDGTDDTRQWVEYTIYFRKK